MKNNSIRFKIIVLYTSILGVVLVFFSIYPIYKTFKLLRVRVESALLSKSKQIDNYFDLYEITSQKDPYAASLLYHLFMGENVHDQKTLAVLWEKETAPLGLEKDYYRIFNLKGEVILRSKNFTDDVERNFNVKLAGYGTTTHFAYMNLNKVPCYGINYQIDFSKMNRLNLQLAVPVTYAQKILVDMVLSYTYGIVIILFLGTFVAKYLTRQVLQPVEEVTSIAKSISHKNLNLRIPFKNYDREVKELVESFNEMIGRLGKSFTYVNDFNSHVSHEMKTPLAIIKGELELALEANNTKEENERVMKGVLEEVYKLNRIIKDMLLLAEFEYKPEIFKKEKMDIIQFLKEVYQHSKLLAEGKNINLVFSSQDGPLWIEGDSTHLRRVFFNLIHNAVKFTPEGGEIRILTEVSDNHFVMSIKDTGIGIAPEHRPKIFDKFFRIQSMENQAIEGNGLGLSMAQAIVNAHKGAISFESEVNIGSTFKVILPIFSH